VSPGDKSPAQEKPTTADWAELEPADQDGFSDFSSWLRSISQLEIAAASQPAAPKTGILATVCPESSGWQRDNPAAGTHSLPHSTAALRRGEFFSFGPDPNLFSVLPLRLAVSVSPRNLPNE
jgi:hypothetical protein